MAIWKQPVKKFPTPKDALRVTAAPPWQRAKSQQPLPSKPQQRKERADGTT
jgi:hypothetical protein